LRDKAIPHKMCVTCSKSPPSFGCACLPQDVSHRWFFTFAAPRRFRPVAWLGRRWPVTIPHQCGALKKGNVQTS